MAIRFVLPEQESGEAGLSKHLRLLARAGVLESRRDGHYVLYSLAPERLESLSASLLAFVRRPG